MACCSLYSLMAGLMEALCYPRVFVIEVLIMENLGFSSQMFYEWSYELIKHSVIARALSYKTVARFLLLITIILSFEWFWMRKAQVMLADWYNEVNASKLYAHLPFINRRLSSVESLLENCTESRRVMTRLTFYHRLASLAKTCVGIT